MPHPSRLFAKGGREQFRPATLGYTYYSTGKVESIQSSNANGANVSYTYDGLNRLSTVVDHRLPSNNTTNYTYDNASNVVTVAYPNGVTSASTYDELNRITELSTSASGTQIADYRYTLGLTGNRTNATEQSGRTLQWSYNGIYQLTNETISGDPVNALDPMGRDIVEYNAANRRLGFQLHHIVEQRFGRLFGGAVCSLAAVLTVVEHQAITNAWRRAIPYGIAGTGLATIEQVFAVAEQIYANSPEMAAALQECKALAGL